MRSYSGGELTNLMGAFRQVGLRVKVANGSGTMKDMSSLSGYNWISSVKIDEEIDQPVSQCTVEFLRSASSTLSLAPLRGDSTLNSLDDGTTYSPLLESGRLITVEAYSIAIGASPSGGDWKLMFKGYIDSVDAAGDKVQCVCRDEGGVLVDTWIKTPAIYAGGDPMEDYIQQILDAWAPGVTLFCPSPTMFEMKAITEVPNRSSVMDYLLLITANIGWDLRYRFDSASGTFRLTLSEPLRVSAVTSWTFDSNRYISVSKMAQDRINVRNYIEVEYGSASPRATYVAQDSTSIAKYGERYFRIVEASNSQIDTLAEATALADAILSDLKDPIAEHAIECPFFWPGQIGDIYAFSSNSVHYNAEQDFAVVGISHDLSSGNHRTKIITRGRAASAYLRWIPKSMPIPPSGGPRIDPAVPAPPGSGPAGIASELWLVSSNLATYDLGSSGLVGFWPDFSGFGNHAVQTNASYKPSIVYDEYPYYGGALPGVGFPAVRCTKNAGSGVINYLTTPQFFIPKNGCTLIVCGRRSGAHEEHNILLRFATVANPSVDQAMVKETHGAEGAGTQNEIKWRSKTVAGSPAEAIISGSLTTSLFVYALRVASSSSASHYFNSLTAAATFDPWTDLDGAAMTITVGEGNYDLLEIAYFGSNLPDSQFSAAMHDVVDKYGLSIT